MLRSTKKMHGLILQATDGSIGKVDQFYFDDSNWAVRYLVADLGGFPGGRRVLISPAALDKPREDGFAVKVTRSQVRSSPDIDTAKPISRLHEIELHDYYSWPYYWAYPMYYNSLGGAIYPGLSSPAGYMPSEHTGIEADALRREQVQRERTEDTHLRSTKEITGYEVQARDETFGHVDDFLVDDSAWVVRYLIITSRLILPDRKVLFAPQWTKGIDWEDAKVYADYPKDIIRNGPEYDPEVEIDRDFENRLYDYYGRPKYWAEE
jgi:hypothetical protein